MVDKDTTFHLQWNNRHWNLNGWRADCAGFAMLALAILLFVAIPLAAIISAWELLRAII